MDIFLKDTSQQSLCVHQGLSVRSWKFQSKLQTDLWFSSGFAFSPSPGQNYADESLECNKVINSGTTRMAEVCHISPAGW